jgi:hypothetical protein
MKLRIQIICITIILLYLTWVGGEAYGQITDNFSDGNFTHDPSWNGNDTDFIVNTALQLQLSSSGTGASYLCLPNTQPINNCEWNFSIRLDFSPSSSNYARVYLASNNSNFSKSLNGYYLQFGESLENDQVELFRQSGTSSVSVCRGTTNIANAFSIRIKVTRDSKGEWKLFMDPKNGTNYVLEASRNDNHYTPTYFFGIYCKHTSGNAANFFFDDFYIYAPPDIFPAILDSVGIVSQNKMDAYFNEEISISSAQTISNYFANNGIGFVSAAMLDSLNPTLVHLTFGNNFTNGQSYTLNVTGVQDIAGNNTLNATNTFLFFIPQANDIVINEIMVDLSPAPNGLPAYEYIELYNRSNYLATLRGWTIADATTIATIPKIIIPSHDFFVLASTSGTPSFSGIPIVGISSFPSLNDTGDDLILRNSNGKIISTVFYRADWYNDPLKNDGGWSLEQVDPNSSCSGKSNWKASADNLGGTPGRKNSVNANVPDIIPPIISHITVISSNSIQLFFNEYMDSTTLLPPTYYSIDNGLGNPIEINPVEPDYKSVLLSITSPIKAGTIYTITLNSVKDCAGNTIATGNSATFGIPEPPAQNDIVINEIMFDPKNNGVEWVEIYNRSSKIIDLKEVFICSQDNNGSFTKINQVAPKGYLLLPKKYIVLSTDANVIKAQYNTNHENGFIDMSSIPSLNNDSDYVALLNVSQAVIDKLHYHSKWHLPLLNDTKGISLERVSFENPTQHENNWHSASKSVGGATPAYQNSQYTNGQSGTEITISPQVFSPDNDSYNDILSINYTFDTPGMIGNVQIYDSRGRLEKTLVRNELLATSGTFFWDGINDEKGKASIGIYIIFFEAFDTKGNVKKYKKSCVVGGKL